MFEIVPKHSREEGASKLKRAPDEKLPWRAAISLFITVFVGGLAFVQWHSDLERLAFLAFQSSSYPSDGSSPATPRPRLSHEDSAIKFELCSYYRRRQCVVDGDTFYTDEDKIRIADIDTPETHPSRCSYEADLGSRATNRILALLNDGPFSLQPIPGRDEDRYGRKLRIVLRDGRSLGDQLVSEGLARTWSGRREPWC